MHKKVLAMVPGSFDPLTVGHLDILERSLHLFSEIVVVVAASVHKTGLFTVEERVEMIRKTVKKYKSIRVDAWDGLIMDYARKHKVGAVVRGLRAASDFEYEFMMAGMNKKLNPKVETVFMMTSENVYFVSSSAIRELVHFGSDVAPYVPPAVLKAIEKKKRMTR